MIADGVSILGLFVLVTLALLLYAVVHRPEPEPVEVREGLKGPFKPRAGLR